MITPYGRAEIKLLNVQLEGLLFSLASQAAFQIPAQQNYNFFLSESLWIICMICMRGDFVQLDSKMTSLGREGEGS